MASRSAWLAAMLAASTSASPILSGSLTAKSLNVEVDLKDVSSSVKSLFLPASGTAPQANVSRCKVYPGDAEWPSDDAWSQLNDLSGGRLIADPTPLAAVC